MKKRNLTKNKNYNNLNILFQNQDKSENKIIFKTVQENNESQNNQLNEAKKKKYVNLFLNHMKNKNNNNNENPTKLLLFNNDSQKLNQKIYLNTSRHNQNTSRHNHSIKNIILDNQKTTREYNKSSSIYINNIIKINKPKLLRLLNKNLLNKKDKEKSYGKIKPRFSFIPQNYIYTNPDYVFNKSTSSRLYSDKQITKNAFSENNRYNTENISEKNREKDKENILKENLNALAKTFIKFPKIQLNFPSIFPNSIPPDKQEEIDTVNLEYFKDEKLKAKLKKALYYELNAFEYDNTKYIEYQNSPENSINFIYDINIIPHLKNKFLYNKTTYEPRKINNILFSKNAINKESAKYLNRFIINNMKKKELEEERMKEKEKKMKELSISNNYLKSLCLDYEDEDFPKMTSDEMVELDDFFGKNSVYKAVTFATRKLKNVVYKESKNKKYLGRFRRSWID